MKSKLTSLIALLLIAALAAGCTGGGTTEASDPADTAPAADPPAAAEPASQEETAPSGDKRNISIWQGLTENELKVFTDTVEDFNAGSELALLESIYIPREELLKQLTIGNLAGDMADLAFIDNPDTAGFAASGVLEDLTDLFDSWSENQFLDGPLASATYDGRIYGVPYAFNCTALFYDIDMLEAANVSVPDTWDDLKEAAGLLTTGDVYGFALAGTKNEEATFAYLPFLLSAGGDVEQIDSEAAVKSMSLLTDMISAGHMSPEIISWSQADVEKQFAAGKCAMMINGPWNVPLVYSDAPDKNWGVAFIPRDQDYSSCLGGENLCVTKGADVEAAWEFIAYLCGSGINAQYCKDVSKFSPRSDVDSDALYGDDEIMKVFSLTMATADARGPHPKWTEISTHIQTMLHEAYTGAKEPAQAAQDAQVKIDEINSSMS